MPRSSPKRRMSATSPTAAQTFSRVVEVQLHQRIEQPLDLDRVQDEVHQEVVHPPQEGAPLEQVAAGDDHHAPDRSCCRRAMRPLPAAAARSRARRRGPRGCAPARPSAPCPSRRQVAVVGRIAVQVGKAGLVEEGRARRAWWRCACRRRRRRPRRRPACCTGRNQAGNWTVMPSGRVTSYQSSSRVLKVRPMSTTSMPKRSRIISSGWASCCTTS